MDKKNTVIGVLLLVSAFGVLFLGQRFSPPPQEQVPEIAPTQAPSPTAPSQVTPGQTNLPASSPSDATFAALAGDHEGEQFTTMENDLVVVRFTNFGGAIADVEFKAYPDQLGSTAPFVFNSPRVSPMLAFADMPGLGANTAYQRVSAGNGEVVYRAILEGRLEVNRRYAVAQDGTGQDPYVIRHETTVRDLSGTGSPQAIASLSLGTTSLSSTSGFGRQYLNVLSWDGEDLDHTRPAELEGGGFLAMVGLKDGTPKTSISKDGPTVWTGVSNQFFAGLYHSDEPGLGTVTRRVELDPLPGSTRANTGVTGVAKYALPTVEPNGSATFGGDFYVGPKEYRRLRQFDAEQDKIMQFAPYFFSRIFLSGIVAPILNLTLVWVDSWVGNWGFAIVVMTLLLKLVTLPFTLAASRSAKRMAKLQPLMKEVREKYKDDPRKQQEATLRIFKENKVNPMGGCLPILITMPLFVAFFSMLQGTAELRFQGFLWSDDLSAPDTVARLFGFPLNIMPLLMGATMIYQMRLTPTPSTDNAQAQMMKFMPLVFTLFCYNFPAALALYSTVNGIFTILQQVIVNKTTKDEPVAVSAGANAVTTASAAWNPGKGKGRKKRK